MKCIIVSVCYLVTIVSFALIVLVARLTVYRSDLIPYQDSGTVAKWSVLPGREDPIQLLEELCRREVRHDERQHCVQLMLNRLVIATGFSSNHYDEALNMIASVQKMMPEVKLIVYDLGMTSQQRATVLQMCGVELRTFNFTKYPQHVRDLFKYAWKPIIANELVKDYEVVMWGDASVRLLKPLQEYILPYLLDIEVPFIGRAPKHMHAIMDSQRNANLFKCDQRKHARCSKCARWMLGFLVHQENEETYK